MAKLGRKLALLAGAAEAARRYAQKNPDKAGKLLDQAAGFFDKQTKGRYSGQIDGFARKAKDLAGVPSTPGRQPFTATSAQPFTDEPNQPFPAEPTQSGAPGGTAQPAHDPTPPPAAPRPADAGSQSYPAPGS